MTAETMLSFLKLTALKNKLDPQVEFPFLEKSDLLAVLGPSAADLVQKVMAQKQRNQMWRGFGRLLLNMERDFRLGLG